MILSHGERQAKEAMNEGVKIYLRAMSARFKELNYDWDVNILALEVELPDAVKLQCYQPIRIWLVALVLTFC